MLALRKLGQRVLQQGDDEELTVPRCRQVTTALARRQTGCGCSEFASGAGNGKATKIFEGEDAGASEFRQARDVSEER